MDENVDEVESDDGEVSGSSSESSQSSRSSSLPPDSYISYGKRPEWDDVTPLPQDDGPDPVVRIAYSQEFQEVYDYLRAVMVMNEMSLRTFHLTTHALRLNPANYTVWEYRRRIIRHLNIDLRNEIEYMSGVIVKNPKNYQVWHHRRVLIEWLNDCTGELDFIEHVFSDSNDWKNFHAWQHRCWLILHFHLTGVESVQKNELSFTKRLLDADLRNNSAWNYRMFLIRKCFFEDGKTLAGDVRESEIALTLSYIRKVPDNESAWNYLMGLLDGASINDFPTILSLCNELHESGRLHQFSLDCEISAIEDKLGCKELAIDSRQALIDRASMLLDLLKNNIDPIRSRYWQYRKELLTGQKPSV